MSFTTAALLVSWLAIALLAFGMAGLMRQIAVLTVRLEHGQSSGSRRTTRDLIGFSLPDTGPGGPLRGPRGSLVLFSSPACASCGEALEDLAGIHTDRDLVVVSSGGCAGVESRLPAARCVEDGGDLMDRLAVPATPYLVAIDADGTIRDVLLPSGPDDIAAWAPTMPTQEQR
ncbi:hypothetical protein [Janibacter anophelis]|uniref:hypothetical protein n=1 Tax=Janibacter anophelis TaxID=319054 RepID=UPI00082B87FC|nr:hypothetical protein [Janibacter anophelis]